MRKHEIPDVLVEDSLNGNGTISFQVVREVLNVHTRRGWADGPERIRILQDVLMPLWTVKPSQELYELAVSLQTRYRYTFYDSLIIAAAIEAGCTPLFSEDMQDGQQIEGLTITNPFA